MRRIHRLSVAAAVVSLSVACGPAANQAAGPPVSPSATQATTSAAPTPTTELSAAPSIEHGPLHKTSVFHLTDNDGYRADVTVRWYEETALTPDRLLPGCQLSGTSSEPDVPRNFTGVVADVEAVFPPTNGLTWPSGSSLTFSFGDGNGTSPADRASTCHTDQDLDSVAEMQTFSVSPVSPKATLMWARSAKKTPDNPNGTVHSEPDGYNVRSSLYLKGCNGTGVEKGILDCTGEYGLDR
ncbi:hypothetical protein OHS18_20390 [Amycolatopsis sp. NBC_00355]|uniref:hypothetical protein n=1 Tax=Amycolatopsis sp. NBC_00355 TaxID=2975957 RepID=UPI002E27754B